MNEANDGVLEVSCPYKNCTAGKGMECHTESGELRDDRHVVRVRKAKETGAISDTAEKKQQIVEMIEEGI